METTKACSKCGEVEFKIESYSGEYKAICINCNNIEATVSLDKYERVIPNCLNCNNDSFKVRVSRDDDALYCDLKCSKCGSSAGFGYCDENGKEIDGKTRELLTIKDSLSELMNKIYSLESDIRNLESRVNIIYSSVDTHDYELTYIKGNINDLKSDISDLK